MGHNNMAQFLTMLWSLLLPLRTLVFGALRLVGIAIQPILHWLRNTSLVDQMGNFVDKHRWIPMLFFVLPASYVFDTYFIIRNWYVRSFLAAPLLHEKRVRDVQSQVRRWNEAGRKKPMCTARPGWLTMSTRIAAFKNDCSLISVNLHDILEIDTKRQVVRVEPLVDMGQITAHLLPLGWTLACMVEMEDLTVGGLLMGLGLEVNSHIFGYMYETVESFEVVLADGSLVRATRNENKDLFHALPMSHGTLGFLVAAELKIIPCKPYMHMRYIPCYSAEELQRKMIEYSDCDHPPSFVEAIVYSKDTSIIMLGEFADVKTPEQQSKVNRINDWWKPFFFRHVEGFFKSGGGDEYLPLRHYYHRHTRSIFWKLEELIPFSNSVLYRYLLGWLGAPKVSFIKLFTYYPEVREKTMMNEVYQDIDIPLTTTKEAIELFDRIFDFYPLLFYPVRLYKMEPGYEGLLPTPRNCKPGKNYEMYFNLGVYGTPGYVQRGEKWDATKAIRTMEKFARDNAGFQFLYADVFQTKEEFEEMFNHSLYRECRKKYNAIGAFPEVWDKIQREI